MLMVRAVARGRGGFPGEVRQCSGKRREQESTPFQRHKQAKDRRGTTRSAHELGEVLRSASTGGAGSRTPFGAIRLLLEVRAGDERLLEVLGIVDDRGDGEPQVAVRLVVAVVIFGQPGALTVGHSVLSQTSSLEVRGDDLQRAALRHRRSAAPGAAASGCGTAAARTRITRRSRVVSTLNDATSGDDAATEAATSAAAWRSARDFPRRRRMPLPARLP